ncbi:MAG TPA: M64 family metallopeptidase [Nocardioidaceae bacterium]|nr:M64 family metallopeptidase [Nocardioidaceae bacterium]
MRRSASVVAIGALLVGFLSSAHWSAASAVSATLADPPPVCNAQPTDPPLPLPEPKVHEIQVTGPPSERLNLIILGDGYQADQQSLFFGDVDRNLAVLWSTEPYRTYRNYINVYAVEIASIDYGVRRDPDGRCRNPDGTIRDTGVREGPIDEKNTALRLWYSDGLTNPLARGTTYGPAPLNCADYADYYPEGVDPCEDGDAAHERILRDYVQPELGIEPTPDNGVQTLAIFNTFTYGGIGGTQATTSGGSPQGPLISMHELGHSLGTLVDEYPYSSRDVVEPCFNGTEAQAGFHHTLYTSEQQMIQDRVKWWRWLGEESLSGGTIGLHEGGRMRPCGVRRPSEHSMMRWIGFDLDQVGLEHMVARITGQRGKGQMALDSTPEGTVPRDSVLWVDTTHPRWHQVDVTWRVEGQVVETDDSDSLDLGELNLSPGTVVSVEARDPVGPDGIDWVRNPSTGNTPTDSGYNGPRFVQSRQWMVSGRTVEPSAPAAEITLSSITSQPVARDEIVYVETNHPSDRVLDVTWRLSGMEIPNPTNNRTLDLGELDLASGTYSLTATVTDPADPGGVSDTVEWTIDNVLPTAHRELSEPVTTLDDDLEHPVYFNGWDMRLDPKDDQTGYDEERFVVGQLRLDRDGWFNYFGFPEQKDAPFQFRHSGTVIKALTYGNLGTGGLSRAAFEQTLPDDHPSGGFIPGFGTHFVEHRAIDPAGNYGDAESYRATVLPGGSPECTRTLTGTQASVTVSSGVTCLEEAIVAGAVTVRAGASLVVTDSTISGVLRTTGAEAVQLFGSTVNRATRIAGTTRDVTVAGSIFNGDVSMTDNTQVSANERYSRLAGAYGPVLAGNTINGQMACTGNSADAKDFGADNVIRGSHSGDCAGL